MKTLVVDQSGRCRSMMVEGAVKNAFTKLGIADATIESAGIHKSAAGKCANDGAAKSMAKLGVDISKARSRWMGDLNLGEFDYIFFVDPGEWRTFQNYVEHPGRLILLYPPNGIPNPYFGTEQDFDDCAETINADVVKQIVELLSVAV